MNKQIILAGIEGGYFRAKDQDKRALLATDIALLLEFQECADGEVVAVLEAEAARRAAVYRASQERKVSRDLANAAKPLETGMSDTAAHIQKMPAGNYIVTVAQNNTSVNHTFLASVLQYCKVKNAQLLVLPTLYNKNAFSQLPGAEDVYYSDAIKQYMVDGVIELTPTLQILANAGVIVTSRGSPLSGFESATDAGVSAIIGTASTQLLCVPVLEGKTPKVLFGTGAVTDPNYILDRKAGAVALATHTIGALLIEVSENGLWQARQIEQMPDTVGFIDSGVWYKPNGVSLRAECVALQPGDIHSEKLPNWALDTLVTSIEKFRPRNVFFHDLLDMASRNHHNRKSPTFIFAQHCADNTVLGDIQQAVDVVNACFAAHPLCRYTVIESNHDLALARFLDETSPQDDPVNAITWLELTLANYKAIEAGKGFHAFEYACKTLCGLFNHVHFHNTDESIIVAGVEMGNHGDRGSNGAKGGGSKGFAKFGLRTNTGHTHSPAITNGLAYVAGVAAGNVDMGYNKGASSWRNASIVTWENGARQIIFLD